MKPVELLRQRWHSATTRFRSGQRMRKRQKTRALPALFETLEDRSLLTAFTVTNLNDSGSGSLRDAVASANAHPGADVIRFQASLDGKIVLTSGQMEITGELAIDGPRMSRITISGTN